MCKLYGWVNSETIPIPYATGQKINKVLRHLMHINTYGNVDGAGLMWTDVAGRTHYMKEAVPGTTFMQFKVFDDMKNDFYRQKFLAGHTRFSTVGSNTWENSHPFHHGNYVGMQNGTIRNNHKSLVPGKVSPCNVDSESVFWSFAQQGVEATFDNYEGEGVFLYIDTENTTFNVVKNDKRNLHRAKVTGLNAYLLCTDKFALELVCGRASLPIDAVEEVPSDQLISYELNGAITQTPMEVPGPNYTYDTTSYYNTWEAWDYDVDSTGRRVYGAYKRELDKKFERKPRKTVLLNPPEETRHSLDEYLTDCDMCSSPLFEHNLVFADHTDFTKAKMITCSSCAKDATSLTQTPMYQVTEKELEWTTL